MRPAKPRVDQIPMKCWYQRLAIAYSHFCFDREAVDYYIIACRGSLAARHREHGRKRAHNY